MKTFCLLLISIAAYAQTPVDSVAQRVVTTQEEYNYLTKGYKVQLESGLDMKKGYTFGKSIGPLPNGNYTFELKPLIRESKKEVAAFLLIATSKAWGNSTYYFCVPRNDFNLSQQFLTDFRKLDAAMARAFAEVAVFTISELAAK